MSKSHKLLWMFIVLTFCIGCDQVTKTIAEDKLKTEPMRSFLADTFRLQYAENTGAFLSLGSNLSKPVRTVLFTVVSGVLLIALVFYILLNADVNRGQTIALSFILGGGLSNLADRIINDGRVVDFMNMGIGSLRTGIFNIADVAIMAGMAFILLMNIQLHRNQKAQQADELDIPDQKRVDFEAMNDEFYMRIAIEEARAGVGQGQTPFGACIVRAGEILATGHNVVWQSTDITAHAEMHTIREACKVHNTIDLSGATIYSSVEPCPMCFSAIHWAKISRIVYGASIADARTAGFNELAISNDIMKSEGASLIEIIKDVLRDESKAVLSEWINRPDRRPY